MSIPARPTTLPDAQRARGPMSLRFEDVAQDGRLVLDALPHGVGVVIRRFFSEGDVGALVRSGVVPILSKLVLEGTGGPVGIGSALESEGAYRLAHVRDEKGDVERLLLDIWIDVFGTIGRTYGPPPERRGERVHVGRVFAEHVFTRPWTTNANERRVRAFDLPNRPAVPADARAWERPEQLLALPTGTTALGDEVLDDALVVFGLSHTDSNQHVNSLVYPRILEEAALRAFARLGMPTTLLAKSCAMAYRKPCFAGDQVRVAVRPFVFDANAGGDAKGTTDDTPTLGIVAAVVAEGTNDRRCFAQMTFAP